MLSIAFRPEINGIILVDCLEEKWPDDMGNPATNPKVFSAWSLGAFGPYVFPGCLERASGQSWIWEPGQRVPDMHFGFIRLRCTYVLGASDESLIRPIGREARHELDFLLELAAAIMELPNTICYFNPNGEVLRGHFTDADKPSVSASNNALQHELIANVRLYHGDDGWDLMDTVGSTLVAQVPALV